jgi:hypothetical protein
MSILKNNKYYIASKAADRELKLHKRNIDE